MDWLDLCSKTRQGWSEYYFWLQNSLNLRIHRRMCKRMCHMTDHDSFQPWDPNKVGRSSTESLKEWFCGRKSKFHIPFTPKAASLPIHLVSYPVKCNGDPSPHILFCVFHTSIICTSTGQTRTTLDLIVIRTWQNRFIRIVPFFHSCITRLAVLLTSLLTHLLKYMQNKPSSPPSKSAAACLKPWLGLLGPSGWFLEIFTENFTFLL